MFDQTYEKCSRNGVRASLQGFRSCFECGRRVLYCSSVCVVACCLNIAVLNGTEPVSPLQSFELIPHTDHQRNPMVWLNTATR